ncbi:phenylacetate--CoA ligase family protein [Mangrovimonas aestuarii]|uniref:CoF synthetase n=1 Tax=Mangrovimonas aestuarii TaxID=3018443 RepID=UPI0023798EBD|nr:CoF synthetase [Mangrovimonas aestuarii]
MSFFESLRQGTFSFIDTFKGKPLKKHLEDIKKGFGHVTSNDHLLHILKHAKDTTDFYKSENPQSGIESFPVINKSILKDHTSGFLSDRFKLDELIPTITSGSTGTPFKSYQNKNKKLRNTADTIFFAHLTGYDVGNKLYYFKIWSRNNRKTKFLQKVQNVVPIDVLDLKKNAGQIIKKLNRNTNSISLLGYVSAFETLYKWLMENPNISINAKINSAITMSEGLDLETKRLLQKKFNCDIYSRYSNVENGILAQQIPGSGECFLINTMSYYFEILDIETDKVLPYGSLGRIVVTDLYNEAMPFIRYDTGDIGEIEIKKIEGKDYHVLSKIEGRKLDQIFNTKGELISSYIVYKNMWQYTEIEQYQFVQEDINKYSLKISLKGEFRRQDQLINEFKSYLGEDAKLSIKYVDEIPLLDSGKRKKVVNLMKLKQGN